MLQRPPWPLWGGTGAFAEITISGDAKFGIDYNSNPGENKSKHSFKHEVGIDFTGSGTTDGGLQFGGTAGFDTGDTETNIGKVWVSGSFGKITVGDNDAADKLAGGISDVGLNGIGVDDIAERHGTTKRAFRYDHTIGNVSIAISAGVGGKEPTTDEQYVTLFKGLRLHFIDALGNRGSGIFLGAEDKDGSRVRRGDDSGNGDHLEVYNLGTGAWERLNPSNEFHEPFIDVFNAYEEAFDVGPDRRAGTDDDTRRPLPDNLPLCQFGCEDQYAVGMSFNAGGATIGFGHDSKETTSVGFGFSTGDIGTNALYVKMDGGKSLGADVSYAMGASTLTLVYSRYSPDMGTKQTGMGFGVSNDLGGGSSLVAGFGRVDDRMGNSNNKASVGLSFTF